MIIDLLASRIWAARRQQTAPLAKSGRKPPKMPPPIELTPEEWEMLRRADALANEIREAEEKAR